MRTRSTAHPVRSMPSLDHLEPRTQPGFLAPINIDVTARPRDIVVADFDRDGRPDLVTANDLSHTINVLLGNGDGTFQAARAYPVAGSPVAIVTADFNRDGIPDLAVAYNQSIGVSILLGNGDGTFRDAGRVGSKGGGSMVVGDFDGDGTPDLAVTNRADGGVSIFLGNGDGTFRPGATYATDFDPVGVAAADFNNDGRLDLVTANYGGAGGGTTVSVLLGNGDGTFSKARSFTVGAGPFSVAVGDLNRDGKQDIVTANRSGGDISVLLGNGDGSFQPSRSFAVGVGPTSVQLVDLDRDGRLDVVTANNGPGPSNFGGVSVLLGNGDGTFQPSVRYETGVYSWAVAVADFNRDGKPDLAVANGDSHDVSVLLGDGLGSFVTAAQYGVGHSGRFVAAADFDGDGAQDLVTASGSTATVLLGNGDGSFQDARDFAVGRGSAAALVVADFNGDGKPDVVVVKNQSAPEGSIAFLAGNGDGSFQAPQPSFAGGGSQFSAMIAGDFDGDGSLDLAITSFDFQGLGTVTILLGNGDGSFREIQEVRVGNLPRSLAIGDFNSDGVPDLAVACSDSNRVDLLFGNGDGTFRLAQSIQVSGASAIVAADLNGDGVPDLAVGNVRGPLRVLLGNGDGTFQQPRDYSAGPSQSALAVGDFSNDGFFDLAATDGQGTTVSVLLGNGDGSFQGPTRYVTGAQVTGLAVGDFNGDGFEDLVTAHSRSNYLALVLNDGNWPGQRRPRPSGPSAALSMELLVGKIRPVHSPAPNALLPPRASALHFRQSSALVIDEFFRRRRSEPWEDAPRNSLVHALSMEETGAMDIMQSLGPVRDHAAFRNG